jgi:hypothetical protein
MLLSVVARNVVRMSSEMQPTQPLPPTQRLPEVESGTGWPEAPTEPVPSSYSSSSDPVTVRQDVADGKPPRRGFLRRRVSRWSGRAFWLAAIAGVVVILLLLTTVLGRWPHLSNPFSSKTTDRSQPVLLLSIQDLARFEAASGNFQVVVDVQEDRSFIPDIIFSQRSLFVAAGSVGAFVDFSNVGKGDVIASADRKSATINLPAPQLDPPQLDLTRSYIYAEQSGLINKIGDLFGGDKNKQQELYLFAQQKISAAAVDTQLSERAKTNTRTMLTELLRSLGFTTITINFAAP